jgi:YHS domain-containing protein
LITTLCVLSAAPAVLGQATEPAKKAGLDTVKVKVWTCSRHEQFRMTEKGMCPLCERDLVSKRVEIQGGEQAGDLYTLETCPVSGLRLGEMGPPVVMMHEGREVRFCCADCIKKSESNPAGLLEEIDQKIVEQQLPYYPMTACPVSKASLGSMGEPVNYVYNNRLVRFCCKGCLRAFKKNPAEYLAELDEAVLAEQMPSYPVKTCPVSQEPLGSMGKPVDLIVANRLVRFCCKGCVGAFFKDPAGQLAKVNQVWTKTQQPKGHEGRSGNDHDHDDHGHDHDHDH